MAVISKSISGKPVTADSLVEAMNREFVPLLRELRAAVNGATYSKAFGNGVLSAFVFEHDLQTRNLGIFIRESVSGNLVNISGLTITFSSDTEVSVSGFGAPPGVDEFVVVVQR